MSEIKKYYDVVICGAGPAGSICAIALGKSGLNVLLIDKSTFPREKICGGALNPVVLKILNTVDPNLKEDLLQFNKKTFFNKTRFAYQNTKLFDYTFPNDTPGFICTRVDFDNFLFQHAKALSNITTLENNALSNIEVRNEKVILKTSTGLEIEARLAIGCDGAHSVVNKKLTQTKVDLNHYAGAVRAYYKNVKAVPQDCFEIHFVKGCPAGYFWIFPLQDNMYNVGFGVLSKYISENKISLRQFLLDITQSEEYKERFKDAELIGEIQGFGLPFGSRKVTISGDHFMLCGDAASLVEPMWGEGISPALVSGRYAAWQAIECFKENNFSSAFMKKYDDVVYKKLWKDNYRSYLARIVSIKLFWAFSFMARCKNFMRKLRNNKQKVSAS